MLTNTGGPSSHRGSSRPAASRHDQQEQSPTPTLVDDPVPHPSRHPRRGPSLEPTNSLQPGLQAGRQAPELTISFTSPNTHPKTATPGDPSQATVATAHTVTGTPSKRYKPPNQFPGDPRLYDPAARLLP